MIMKIDTFHLIMMILSLVSHVCHFMVILSNRSENTHTQTHTHTHKRILFFAGKYLPPFHEILYRKFLFKNTFDSNEKLVRFSFFVFRYSKNKLV